MCEYLINLLSICMAQTTLGQPAMVGNGQGIQNRSQSYLLSWACQERMLNHTVAPHLTECLRRKKNNIVNARLDAFLMYDSFSCLPFWTKQYKKDSDGSNLVLWNLSGSEQERTSTTSGSEDMKMSPRHVSPSCSVNYIQTCLLCSLIIYIVSTYLLLYLSEIVTTLKNINITSKQLRLFFSKMLFSPRSPLILQECVLSQSKCVLNSPLCSVVLQPLGTPQFNHCCA